jgi:hypothetical protein
MPKKNVLSSTISTIIGTPVKTSWPLTTSNPLHLFRITHKALKASKLNQIKSEAMKYDVVGID